MAPHTVALHRVLIRSADGLIAALERAVREWEKWLDAETKTARP